MRNIARITSIIFMLAGLLILLLGLLFAFVGMGASQSKTPGTMDGLIILLRLVGGAAIGMQGLFLAALGEGLWLIAGIHEQTQRTADLFSRLTRRSQ